MFRTALKNMLGTLSKWAILKHQMKLYVVTGWHGTEISRELAYSILGSTKLVRRMTKNVWWDLSVPLAILGYDDHKRNPIAWLWLLFKATAGLLFFKKNPHTLILNINYSDAETASYWAGFVRPDMLLIPSILESLPFLQKIVKVTKESGGYIICDSRDQDKIIKMTGDYKKLFYFGEHNAQLQFSAEANNGLKFNYQNKDYRVKKTFMPWVSSGVIAGSVALALVDGMEIMDVLYELVKFQMPAKMLQKIKIDLQA